MLKSVLKSGQEGYVRFGKVLKKLAGTTGLEPATSCVTGRLAASTVFSQPLLFVALTRFWGVCFRSQRLRLARLMGEFSDGFLTVVAITAMRCGLRSLLSSAIQSLRYQRFYDLHLLPQIAPRSSFNPPRLGWNPELDEPVLRCRIEPAVRSVFMGLPRFSGQFLV